MPLYPQPGTVQGIRAWLCEAGVRGGKKFFFLNGAGLPVSHHLCREQLSQQKVRSTPLPSSTSLSAASPWRVQAKCSHLRVELKTEWLFLRHVPHHLPDAQEDGRLGKSSGLLAPGCRSPTGHLLESWPESGGLCAASGASLG